MTKKKKTTLIEGGHIACNQICQAIKEKGLPHNSIWIHINHLVRNLDADPRLTTDQRRIITRLCDKYLPKISHIHNPEIIHQQGLQLLADIREIQQSTILQRIKEEQKFTSDLLATISRSLEKIYQTIGSQTADTTITQLKSRTLQALQNIHDRATILAIVEDGFDQVSQVLKSNMAAVRNSFDSLLELESKALLDPLTTIFNRRFFDQELPRIVRTFLDLEGAKPFSMLVIDIDNFKEVNDRHGHFIGDSVIQRVAEILQKNCRAGIDSPIRLGGDEFALFLIGAPLDVAVHKANIIREQIAGQSFHFSSNAAGEPARKLSFSITVSIGVSQLDYSWKDVVPTQLIGASLICNPENTDPCYMLTCKIFEAADEALYDAKNSGKNKVCVYSKQF